MARQSPFLPARYPLSFQLSIEQPRRWVSRVVLSHPNGVARCVHSAIPIRRLAHVSPMLYQQDGWLGDRFFPARPFLVEHGPSIICATRYTLPGNAMTTCGRYCEGPAFAAAAIRDSARGRKLVTALTSVSISDIGPATAASWKT